MKTHFKKILGSAGYFPSEIDRLLNEIPEGEDLPVATEHPRRFDRRLTNHGKEVAAVAITLLRGHCWARTIARELRVTETTLRNAVDVPPDFNSAVAETWKKPAQLKYRRETRLRFAIDCLRQEKLPVEQLTEFVPGEDFGDLDIAGIIAKSPTTFRVRIGKTQRLNETAYGLLYWSNAVMPGRFSLATESAVLGTNVEFSMAVRKRCGLTLKILRKKRAEWKHILPSTLRVDLGMSPLPLADHVLFWALLQHRANIADEHLVAEPPFNLADKGLVGALRRLPVAWDAFVREADGSVRYSEQKPQSVAALETVLSERIGYCRLKLLQDAFDLPDTTMRTALERVHITRAEWEEKEKEISAQLLLQAKENLKKARKALWKASVAQILKSEGLSEVEIADCLSIQNVEMIWDYLEQNVRHEYILTKTRTEWEDLTYVERVKLILIVTNGAAMVTPNSVQEFERITPLAFRKVMEAANTNINKWEKKRRNFRAELRKRIPTSVRDSILNVSQLMRLKMLANREHWTPEDILAQQFFPSLRTIGNVNRHVDLPIAFFSPANFYQEVQMERAIEIYFDDYQHLDTTVDVAETLVLSARIVKERAASVRTMKTNGEQEHTEARLKFAESLILRLPGGLQHKWALRALVLYRGANPRNREQVLHAEELQPFDSAAVNAAATADIEILRKDRTEAQTLLTVKALLLYLSHFGARDTLYVLIKAFGLTTRMTTQIVNYSKGNDTKVAA